MDYREYLPPPELASFVRCTWTLSSDAGDDAAPSAVETILPDGCMELVVHWREPFARVRDGERSPQPRAFLVGQIREPFVVARSARAGVVSARFELGGAAPWLRGTAAHELTGRELALADLWPNEHRELIERIAIAADDRSRAFVLERWLLAHARPGSRHPSVAAAARWFERTRGRLPADALGEHLGLGPRQVQRLFAQEVGLGPKLCGRIARFQSLLATMHEAPEPTFAAHAARSGYADQAHLIRDFREFAGTTPRAWLASRTPFAAALAGFES